jgi:hypothetical protein
LEHLLRSSILVSFCHSRESGNPLFSVWIPAYAGMTANMAR